MSIKLGKWGRNGDEQNIGNKNPILFVEQIFHNTLICSLVVVFLSTTTFVPSSLLTFSGFTIKNAAGSANTCNITKMRRVV